MRNYLDSMRFVIDETAYDSRILYLTIPISEFTKDISLEILLHSVNVIQKN